MGAQNIGRVFVGWGGQLTDRPFRLLVYMALRSLDRDADPWFGEGHAVLAEVALGLKLPEDPDDWKGRDAVLRKVRRHITPLLTRGAIETRTRAVTVPGRDYGSKHVVYRLFLDGPWKSSPFMATLPEQGSPLE